MSVPREIQDLTERFTRNLDDYRSGRYKEAQLRKEFVDPFFEALGWDVANRQGYAEAYKDVVNEDALRMGRATKAPDYCFRVGGIRKFFVEAKKPSVNVKEDVDPAYQLRRYAWSAKLPLSILTDFEELAVYDCRVKPAVTDKASVARILFCTYDEYEKRWEEIEAIFSREAVLKGSFDRYADSGRGRRGTAEVDAAFLKDIESWRDVLARNLAIRNPSLTQSELNFAVQSTIDRIVFLRICEDRSIEEYGRLQALLSGTNTYARLLDLYRRADERYNSGLFHFRKEKERLEPPDDLTPQLVIDDKPLKEILGGLYYPESPYEFSVLPADILGQVYEQFLGKVIRLTAGHQAKVEDKPEVKKAGGVYYTPTYIVDYIVRHTLGKLLGKKTPRQAAKLRVLDPACGSGSFLIGAYQYLLDWHRDRYVENGPAKRRKELYRGPAGDWRLTTSERKRILLNNIYGVDIDPQAVEVTKLSLLLKVLEGETGETLKVQRRLFEERALPDLADNVKCGNSLVGSDYSVKSGRLPLEIHEGWRVNAFDWDSEYAHKTAGSGFDAVVGNPPYVLLQSLDQPDVFRYLSRSFASAKYKIDMYQVFLERALTLASPGGYVGFITPNTYLRNKFARDLREFILENSQVEILRLFSYPVFAGASVDSALIILRRCARPDDGHAVTIVRSDSVLGRDVTTVQFQREWRRHPELEFGLVGGTETASLLARIRACSFPLGKIADAYFGIQTRGRDTVVQKRKLGRNPKPVVDGANISRYHLEPPREYLDFQKDVIKSGGKQSVHESARLGVRQIGRHPIATLIPAGTYALNTIYNVYFTQPSNYALLFVLGVMCSRVARWYWEQCFFDQKRTFPKIKKQPLLSIPLPTVDFDDPRQRKRHGEIVRRVEEMLALKNDAAGIRVSSARTSAQRQIDALDRRIDQLVYEMYGLSDKEIRIVEEAVP